MASSWTIYTPDPPSAGDFDSSEGASQPAKAIAWTPRWNSNATYPDHSDLARGSPPASSEVVEPTTKLANMEVPSVQGRTEPNSFSSNVVRFTSTKGSRMETTSKPAPIVVSATSLRVGFRDPGVATAIRGDALSIEPLPVKFEPRLPSSLPPATHSPDSLRLESPPVSTTPLYDTDWSVHRTSTTHRPDNVAPNVVSSSHPTHKQVVAPRPSSPLGTRDTTPQIANSSKHVVPGPMPSWTLDEHVLGSASITNSPAIAPILAATDVTPQPYPEPIHPNPISTTDISSTSSPGMGASQPTPATQTTTLNTAPEPNKQRKRPRRAATWVSAGSDSIVLSRYTEMMFEEVPTRYTFLSCFFTWVLLAGFVVLPGTFSALEDFETSSGELGNILRTIRHLPLYVPIFPPPPSLLFKPGRMNILSWPFVVVGP